MADFYANMAAVAARLIKQYGATVTLPRQTGEIIDPVTGAVTSGSSETKTTKGILKPYPDNLIDGTLIKSTDKMLVLTNAVKPLMTDTPKMGSNTLGEVVSIKTASPAGTDIVYFLQMRA